MASFCFQGRHTRALGQLAFCSLPSTLFWIWLESLIIKLSSILSLNGGQSVSIFQFFLLFMAGMSDLFGLAGFQI